MRKLLTVIIAVTSLGALNAFGDASFQGLGGSSSNSLSVARGISPDGSVVVGYTYCFSWTGTYEAFRWSETTGMAWLPNLFGGYLFPPKNFAYAASAYGAVIVGLCISGWPYNASEACRWTAPSYSVESLASLGFGGAAAVSADGSVIVGTNSAGVAARWTEATGMVDLGGGTGSSAADVSADGSVVVGTWNSNNEAFRWTAATGMVGLSYLPGTSKSQANSVSADGLVVVGACNPSSNSEAFRWTATTGMVGLGHLPGTYYSQANGVSGDGSVVVGNCGQAFVWDAVNGMRSLRDMLVNEFGLDLTGWVLSSASDISADGQRIVGSGTNPNGSTEAWLATIPELTILTLVPLDIKPGACPNPLNIRPAPKDMWMPGDETPTVAKVGPDGPQRPTARLTAAILGTTDFDVADIDPASITLEGVAALHWNIEDVSTPVGEGAEECECTDEGADGYQDLTLKFDKSLIIEALGEIYVGDTISLTINGELTDGTPFEGTDCVVIVGGPPPAAGAPPSRESLDVVLIGNFPNPFNPTTEISFSLPAASHVKLEVYNVMGQKVATLVDGQLEAGEHIVPWDGSDAASGVYLYRLQADNFVDAKKMILLK